MEVKEKPQELPKTRPDFRLTDSLENRHDPIKGENGQQMSMYERKVFGLFRGFFVINEFCKRSLLD